ncbi:MAG: hypothetical protein KIT87_23605 [Anaerolineae bacterium]|nr:hypothetical protein [Anaerolineae bacterium]
MRLIWPLLLALLIALASVVTLNRPSQAQTSTLLLVSAQDIAFLAQAGQDTRATITLGLASSGASIAWTAKISPTVGWLVLGTTQGLAPSLPSEPIELPVYLQTLGLPRGEYRTQIILTADESVANSPVIIPVTLYVADQIRQVHLPLIAKNPER